MSDILFQYYRVNPTTWFYLSSLLSIAVFFKFNRVWSMRNLDLVGLILLAPGLLAGLRRALVGSDPATNRTLFRFFQTFAFCHENVRATRRASASGL
jgi:hypothetical protein